MRGSAPQRPRQPLLHLRPGDRVERGEGLVEGEHRLAGDAACAGRRRAGASRRRARSGRCASKPARPKRSNSAAARGRASALPQAAVAQRQRRVVERRVPGQEQVALGHVGAARPAARRRRRRRRPRSCRRSARAGRRSAPAGSTCRSPRARPGRAPRVGATSRSSRVDRPQLAVGVVEAGRVSALLRPAEGAPRAGSRRRCLRRIPQVILVSWRTPHS